MQWPSQRHRGGRGWGPFRWQWFFQNCPVFRNTSCLPSPGAKHVCQAAQQKINEEVSLSLLPSSGLYYNPHTSGGQGYIPSTSCSVLLIKAHRQWKFCVLHLMCNIKPDQTAFSWLRMNYLFSVAPYMKSFSKSLSPLCVRAILFPFFMTHLFINIICSSMCVSSYEHLNKDMMPPGEAVHIFIYFYTFYTLYY